MEGRVTRVTTATAGAETADDICRDCGDEPALKRSLNGFQIFAVAFASVSVVMGIFATYGDALRNSGPVGIWLFPVVGVGQLLVADVLHRGGTHHGGPRS